jgi:uncharacterized coiled-coil protein SlyX
MCQHRCSDLESHNTHLVEQVNSLNATVLELNATNNQLHCDLDAANARIAELEHKVSDLEDALHHF